MSKNLTNWTKTIAIFALVVTPLSMSRLLAQNVKKYALVEHFTNTRCGICASNNPSFFTTIGVETNKNVHHVSYHSRIPYSDCALYVLNKTEQDTRADLYSIGGTPRAAVNGVSTVPVSSVSAQTITDNATTSPLEVSVTESGNSPRQATVLVKWVGTPPSGNHEILIAIVEKKVSYSAPNGEKTHYNVFRKFLKKEALTLPAKGAEKSFPLQFNIESAWVGSEIYVLAFVQNIDNKQVINSGTKFDPSVSSLPTTNLDAQVSLSPNPCTEKCFIQFDKMTPQYLTVSDVSGKIFLTEKRLNNDGYELNLKGFARGLYFVKIQSAEGVALKKVVVE